MPQLTVHHVTEIHHRHIQSHT